MKIISFFQTTLLVTTLFLSSCADFSLTKKETSANRILATDISANYDVDGLLTFFSTSEVNPNHNFLKSSLPLFQNKSIVVTFIEDSKLSNDTAYIIKPKIEDQSFKLDVYHSKSAPFDRIATEEVGKFIRQQIFTKFHDKQSIFELYYNALRGDINALITFTQMRQDVVDDLYIQFKDSKELGSSFIADRKAAIDDWSDVFSDLNKTKNAQDKIIRAQTEKRKAIMDVLDKASDDKQFKTLVANNDRKGVADLLRKYLPWELMSPFEKKFWENHLHVLSDPLPLNQRIILYRGVADDIVQVSEVLGKNLSKDQAILQKQVFFMSTMLTKNQGTWNRRLRSLTAMNEKFIGQDANGATTYSKALRVTNMFAQHSSEPQGSPYLSLSPDFSVAQRFGANRTTAYFVDPRIVHYNFVSGYSSEIEYLIPLTTFPEDLAGIVDVKLLNIKNSEMKKVLEKQMEETLIEKYGAKNGAIAFKEIQERTKAYTKTTTEKGGATKNPKLASGENISDLYKELYSLDAKKAGKIIKDNKDLTCLDLMQAFWEH